MPGGREIYEILNFIFHYEDKTNKSLFLLNKIRYKIFVI